MAASFDHIAAIYDEDFTATAIGEAQRNFVFQGVSSCFESLKNTSVLEINCGTGQDALKLAEMSATVLATDISPKMVSVAQQKTAHLPNVNCEVLDINKLEDFHEGEKFDLIFSNFGGLNCLSANEMTQFFANARKKLNPNGKLILVIMPDFCAWESLYFSSKFQFSKAFRRKSEDGVMANVDGQKVKTYYYSPSKIEQMAEGFKTLKTQPVGFYVPPSYLNPFFKKRRKTFKKLVKWDKKRMNNEKFAPFSDHFLICLQRN